MVQMRLEILHIVDTLQTSHALEANRLNHSPVRSQRKYS